MCSFIWSEGKDMLSHYRGGYCDLKVKVLYIDLHSLHGILLHELVLLALFSTPGYIKSIESSLCLCPHPASLALCAMKALSQGTLPGGLMYGLVPLHSHSAVKA